MIINEVSPKGDNNEDWVEIFNKRTNPINLKSWVITDNTSSDTLSTIDLFIPAGGYAIIVTNNSIITASIPSSATTVTINSLAIGNGLAHQGDQLTLKDENTNVIDMMSWGNDHTLTPHTPGQPGENKTLSRQPNGVDTNSGDDWISNATPSTGTTNP